METMNKSTATYSGHFCKVCKRATTFILSTYLCADCFKEKSTIERRIDFLKEELKKYEP